MFMLRTLLKHSLSIFKSYINLKVKYMANYFKQVCIIVYQQVFVIVLFSLSCTSFVNFLNFLYSYSFKKLFRYNFVVWFIVYYRLISTVIRHQTYTDYDHDCELRLRYKVISHLTLSYLVKYILPIYFYQTKCLWYANQLIDSTEVFVYHSIIKVFLIYYFTYNLILQKYYITH